MGARQRPHGVRPSQAFTGECKHRVNATAVQPRTFSGYYFHFLLCESSYISPPQTRQRLYFFRNGRNVPLTSATPSTPRAACSGTTWLRPVAAPLLLHQPGGLQAPLSEHAPLRQPLFLSGSCPEETKMLCSLPDTLGTHLLCEESWLTCLDPSRAGSRARAEPGQGYRAGPQSSLGPPFKGSWDPHLKGCYLHELKDFWLVSPTRGDI